MPFTPSTVPDLAPFGVNRSRLAVATDPSVIASARGSRPCRYHLDDERAGVDLASAWHATAGRNDDCGILRIRGAAHDRSALGGPWRGDHRRVRARQRSAADVHCAYPTAGPACSAHLRLGAGAHRGIAP